jgi:hypothetical protein
MGLQVQMNCGILRFTHEHSFTNIASPMQNIADPVHLSIKGLYPVPDKLNHSRPIPIFRKFALRPSAKQQKHYAGACSNVRANYTALSGLQFIAVLGIVGFHYFPQFAHPQIYEIFQSGPAALSFFFLLSGFVLYIIQAPMWHYFQVANNLDPSSLACFFRG